MVSNISDGLTISTLFQPMWGIFMAPRKRTTRPLITPMPLNPRRLFRRFQEDLHAEADAEIGLSFGLSAL